MKIIFLLNTSYNCLLYCNTTVYVFIFLFCFFNEMTVSLSIKSGKIHTYIIGHYNPTVRMIDLVSHNTYVVCAFLDIKGGSYSLKLTPNYGFLRNFSWQFYLLSEFLIAICWEEIAEKNTFCIMFDVWPGARTRTINLISQRTTY